MPTHARLFVVSGPSGAGKGTLVSLVREKLPRLGLTVSATTRTPRPGELEGESYYFLTDEQFDEKLAQAEFLEWANVFGKRYGTLKSEVDRLLANGSSVLLEIDVQGGLQVKEAIPSAVLIFIEPPSLDELERRLRQRGTEDEQTLQLRLSKAEEEMRLGELYDERIVNDNRSCASDQLAELIEYYETIEKDA